MDVNGWQEHFPCQFALSIDIISMEPEELGHTQNRTRARTFDCFLSHLAKGHPFLLTLTRVTVQIPPQDTM